MTKMMLFLKTKVVLTNSQKLIMLIYALNLVIHSMISKQLYMAQSDDYAKGIQEIDKEIAKDPYNTDLLERRQELFKAQQEATSNAEQEKQSIKSLVEEGIKAQLDALQKLIDKYKEALNSKKNLYDYQKSVNEKTSNIASIQKQINAYGGENSEETQSKIQQLQQNLKEAKSDLEDTEYQQYLSDQEQLLDTFYDETEEAAQLLINSYMLNLAHT